MTINITLLVIGHLWKQDKWLIFEMKIKYIEALAKACTLSTYITMKTLVRFELFKAHTLLAFEKLFKIYIQFNQLVWMSNQVYS